MCVQSFVALRCVLRDRQENRYIHTDNIKAPDKNVALTIDWNYYMKTNSTQH